MKEDNNIKMLIASILKLSLKLSKCKESVDASPKTKASHKTKASPKTKTSPKRAPRQVKKKIVGGGQEHFFE
jgi:hypothetical protein